MDSSLDRKVRFTKRKSKYRCMPVYVSVVLLIAACGQQSNISPPEVQLLKQKLGEVETRLAKSDSMARDLDNRLKSLEIQQMADGWRYVAFLKPGDSGYSKIDFDLGALTVQLSDAKPFASGSRIELRFGNPLASNITGVHAKIDWGRLNQSGVIIRDSEHSKEVTFIEPLKSGSWTNLSVVLDGIQPADLGYVRISELRHDGLALIRH